MAEQQSAAQQLIGDWRRSRPTLPTTSSSATSGGAPVSGTALIGARDGTAFEAHPGETVACRAVGVQGRRHPRDYLERAGHRRPVQAPSTRTQ
jgi:hypothetical protein